MRRLFFLGALTLVFATLQVPAFAGLVLTQNGTVPGPLVEGNLTFSNFFCDATATGGPIVSPSDCGSLSVVAPVVGGPNGITFHGPFTITVPAGGTVDVVLSYDVTASSAIIHDIFMDFDGSVSGTGSFIATISENAFSGNTKVGTANVSAPIGSTTSGDVILTGGPYASLHITKDIQIIGIGAPGQVGLITFSNVTQDFSETIPEPGTITLLGTALLGCAALFRRRLSKR